MRKLTILQFLIGIALIASPVYSADMQDYGKIWTAWGKNGQTAYIWGFIDGGTAVMLTAMEEYISSGKQIRSAPKNCGDILDNTGKITATLFDEYKLIDVITNLYKDLANSYILFGDMVYIARDSLKGNDVTDALLKARKHAIATYELNKKKWKANEPSFNHKKGIIILNHVLTNQSTEPSFLGPVIFSLYA